MSYLRPCNCWRCRQCHKKVLADDRARMEAGIRQFPDGLALVTLNLPDEFHEEPPSAGYGRLHWGLGQFLSLLAEKHGPFEYLWVYEAHQSDILHLHLLVSGFLATLVRTGMVRKANRVVKDLSKTRGLGISRAPVSSHLKTPAGSRKAAGYFNKADHLPLHLPLGKRRYGASRGFLPKRTPLPKPPGAERWIYRGDEPADAPQRLPPEWDNPNPPGPAS
ncbi:MAG: hypothetical protein L6R43_04505 [Planctomycetes bacterium]|nr:hypothetical protein [Planctomycetota bacterium]